jgi:thioredoxin 1
MPTFLVFTKGSVTETIRGANPSALRTAVSRAASASGKASTATFQSKGYTLGSANTPSRPVGGSGSSFLGSLGTGGAGGLADDIVRFFGLYLTTLFSFDGYAAAEASPFKVARR